MSKHRVIAGFMNVVPGATYHPAKGGKPVTLERNARVNPPGEFESPDAGQLKRLIAARCLEGDGTPSAASATGTAPKGSGGAGGGAASHGGGTKPARETAKQKKAREAAEAKAAAEAASRQTGGGSPDPAAGGAEGGSPPLDGANSGGGGSGAEPNGG